MAINMKTKWAVLAGFSAVLLWTATGCFETDGGSSSNDGPGSTNKPAIVQISFTVPVCSASTSLGNLNGAVFNGGAGYLYISPTCTDSNASMYVWIKVGSTATNSEVAYYEWTIRNWSGAAPNGIFTPGSYDSVIETNGVLKVRTSMDRIQYMSTATSNLLALASVFDQVIDVTVMTQDGRMATGYVSLKLFSGDVSGANLVFGSLRATDHPSAYRPANYADYYTFTNGSGTNLLSMEGDFATTLVLYDTNLTVVAVNEGLFSGSTISEIVSVLSNGVPYLVEATSANLQGTGNYSIFSSGGSLTPIPSPFDSAGSCSSIAGTYAMNQTLVVEVTFGGLPYAFTNYSSSVVTITQSGCDFMYPVQDPTGLVPPTLLMGKVEFNNLSLYNEAIMPQTSELFISSSGVSGTGTTYGSGSNLSINSAGSVTGTYLGLPFSVNYTCDANLTK